MAVRVAIVDDDVWVRTGRAYVLGQTPGFEVTAAVAHQGALVDPAAVADADVVLVDAYDPEAGFDRFPGVAVVKAVRAQSGNHAAIVVVTGHVTNDLLRLRMAEAGADLCYGHDDVSDPEHLLAVLRAAADRSPGLSEPLGDDERQQRRRPEAGLDWVRQHGWEPAFSGESQKALPFSRRAVIRMRKELAGIAGIGPSGSLPPWRQVRRFVDRARGAEVRPPQERAEDEP